MSSPLEELRAMRVSYSMNWRGLGGAQLFLGELRQFHRAIY